MSLILSLNFSIKLENFQDWSNHSRKKKTEAAAIEVGDFNTLLINWTGHKQTENIYELVT